MINSGIIFFCGRFFCWCSRILRVVTAWLAIIQDKVKCCFRVAAALPSHTQAAPTWPWCARFDVSSIVHHLTSLRSGDKQALQYLLPSELATRQRSTRYGLKTVLLSVFLSSHSFRQSATHSFCAAITRSRNLCLVSHLHSLMNSNSRVLRWQSLEP